MHILDSQTVTKILPFWKYMKRIWLYFSYSIDGVVSLRFLNTPPAPRVLGAGRGSRHASDG
jgi:hypothetical protein